MDLFRAFQHNSSSSNSELLANADSQAGDTVVSLDSDFDEDATESASAGARPRKPIRATTTSVRLSRLEETTTYKCCSAPYPSEERGKNLTGR